MDCSLAGAISSLRGASASPSSRSIVGVNSKETCLFCLASTHRAISGNVCRPGSHARPRFWNLSYDSAPKSRFINNAKLAFFNSNYDKLFDERSGLGQWRVNKTQILEKGSSTSNGRNSVTRFNSIMCAAIVCYHRVTLFVAFGNYIKLPLFHFIIKWHLYSLMARGLSLVDTSRRFKFIEMFTSTLFAIRSRFHPKKYLNINFSLRDRADMSINICLIGEKKSFEMQKKATCETALAEKIRVQIGGERRDKVEEIGQEISRLMSKALSSRQRNSRITKRQTSRLVSTNYKGKDWGNKSSSRVVSAPIHSGFEWDWLLFSPLGEQSAGPMGSRKRSKSEKWIN